MTDAASFSAFGSLDDWLAAMSHLVEAGDVERAAALMARVPPGSRDHPYVHVARAEIAMFRGELDAAEAALRRALALDPGSAPALHDLGAVLLWQQRYAEAITAFRAAVERRPGHTPSALGLAHALFSAGEFAIGWRWYEKRAGGLAQRPRPRGLWDGTPIPQGTVAIVLDEGLGDVAHLCRYAPAVRDRVGRLCMLADGQYRALAPLLRSLPELEVFEHRDALPPLNAYCQLGTVAHIAGASLDNVGRVPYLAPAAERLDKWRAILGARHRPRIGVAWAGNPGTDARARHMDSRRSFHRAQVLALIQGLDVEWHALQVGPRAEPLPDVIGHASQIEDYGDTAALMLELDLVICTDSSVAHVAGAIGAPVWLMQRFDGDWHFAGQACATAWYPTMRIFRQPTLGDWATVIGDVRAALQAWRAAAS